VRDILTAKVLQSYSFQIAPDTLGRVQLRGIPRQLLQMDSPCCTTGQEVLYWLAPVDRSPIPDDQQLLRDTPQQLLKKPDYVFTVVGPLLHHHVQLPLGGNPTHHRKVVTAERGTDERCLTHWGIGTHHCGQHVETTLVHEYQGPLFLYGFF